MNWGIIFFVWIGVVGLAFLWSGQSMKMNNKITVGWLIGQDTRLDKCRDVPGFIAETYPKVMWFGAVIVVAAILLILLEAFHVSYAPVVELLVLLALIVMYAVFNHQIKQATQKFLR